MKEEYDFSKGERGKFFDPEAQFKIPVYLDQEALSFVQEIAKKRKADISEIVNQLIHTDKRLAEIIQ